MKTMLKIAVEINSETNIVGNGIPDATAPAMLSIATGKP
jgi:hypothetical protein